MTDTKTKQWFILANDWPPEPNKRYTFFNAHLDDYRIDTMEGIERNFKRFHQHHERAEGDEDNEAVQRLFKYYHRWTHWQEAPTPPQDDE